MRYHDYHLRGYSVSDFGNTISLDLVFDYPNAPRDESTIQFSDVIAYHFIHSGGAIIVEIAEIALSKISKEIESVLTSYGRQFGGAITNFREDKGKLEMDGYKVWTIGSAIGFEGLIVAKNAK